MKVNLYIRVSTDRQVREGDSLEEQENELKKYCDYRNFEIKNIYIEEGLSAGTTNRPEYQKLLKDIREKKVDAVIVKKIDRLSRSLLDFEAFMKLSQENDIEFIAIKENFDTTSALGKAMLRMALVFAQLEREQTSERITDVMTFRASKGQYNGGIPSYGYTCASKELIPYPKEKQVIEIMFEQFLKTKSTTQTAKILNDAGHRNRHGKKWDMRRLYQILRNPVYKGILRWKGVEYQGLHQPIISEKIFYEVQSIINIFAGFKTKSKTKALLQSMLFCGYCGRPMVPSHSLNRHKKKYYYYRCNSTHSAEKGKPKCKYKYIPYKTLEDAFFNLLLSLTDEFHFKPIELKINQHNETIKEAKSKLQTQIQTNQMHIAETKSKKDKYLDTLISSQFLSSERELINKKIKELDNEETFINNQLINLQFELSKKKEELINSTEIKQVLVSFKANHEEFSHSQLKEFIITHIKKVRFYPKKLGITFKVLPWELDFST
jgi:site-specific DNA recombinase